MSADPTVNLLHALVNNLDGPDIDRAGWASMAIILEFPDGAFNEAHGFLYSPDGSTSAVVAAASAVEPAVDAYTSSHFGAEESLPVQILVQLDRDKGQYEVTFEDTDASRWKMTPRNRSTFRDELRPQFD